MTKVGKAFDVTIDLKFATFNDKNTVIGLKRNIPTGTISRVWRVSSRQIVYIRPRYGGVSNWAKVVR